MRANLRLLLRLYGDSRPLLLVGAAAAVGQSALLVPVALLVRRVFDRSIPGKRPGEIALEGLAVFLLYSASAVLGLVSRRVIVRISKESVGRLRVELLTRLYALPREWHDAQNAGELHAVVVNDSERLDYLVSQIARSVVPAVIIGVALAAVALVLNPLMFTVLLVAVPALSLAGRRLAQGSRRLSRVWLDTFQVFSAQTHLALRAMTLTRVQGAEAWEVERRTLQIGEVTRTSRAFDTVQATHAAVQSAIVAAVGSGLLIIGGVAVTRGDITLGGLLAFYAVGVLLLRQFAVIGPGLTSAVVAAESIVRLDRLLATDVLEPYRGTRPPAFPGPVAVAFDGVSFGYGPEPVVQDISLSVAPGEHLALVGPNGSGKTTLVSLLLGFYRPAAGRIAFDGVPLVELDVRALRRQIGVVLQDPILFTGSIAENIAYGHPDRSDRQRMVAAARAALAAEFIDELPGGYETQIGDDGVLLSGGQRQRLALARAMMDEPALLVFDEPTTHLDGPTIGRLMDSLAGLANAPTIIVVTHDPEVAGRADRVVHLRDGRIAGIADGWRSGPAPSRTSAPEGPIPTGRRSGAMP